MSFDVVAELTRWTARLSLFLFVLAFVFDVQRVREGTKQLLWLFFVIAHATHLGFVLLYFVELRELPKFDFVLVLLCLGLIAFLRISTSVLRPTIKTREFIAPAYDVWLLWFLFGATHVSRLIEPGRSGLINWVLLTIVFLGLGLRLRKLAIGREFRGGT